MNARENEICIELGPPLKFGSILFSSLGIYLLLQSSWNVTAVKHHNLPIFTWPIIFIFLVILAMVLYRNLFYSQRLIVQCCLLKDHAQATVMQCKDIIDVTVENPPLYQSAEWAWDWFGFGRGLLVIHTTQQKIYFGSGISYEEALGYKDAILTLCSTVTQKPPPME